VNARIDCQWNRPTDRPVVRTAAMGRPGRPGGLLWGLKAGGLILFCLFVWRVAVRIRDDLGTDVENQRPGGRGQATRCAAAFGQGARRSGPAEDPPAKSHGSAGPPPAVDRVGESAAAIEAAVALAWERESSNGADRRSWPIHLGGRVGPAGERGAYQLTPVFVADVRRISRSAGGPARTVDPYDDAACRWAIRVYLSHYAPRPATRAETAEELYQLFHLGPGAYRRWATEAQRTQGKKEAAK